MRNRLKMFCSCATDFQGASEAVAVAMATVIDPGDEVILHEPSYVAYVPAVVFNGGKPGEGHVRCSYATAYEQLEEALVRMERFVGSLGA